MPKKRLAKACFVEQWCEFVSLYHILLHLISLLKEKFKGHEHGWGYKKGVALLWLLSRLEKSLGDWSPECQMWFQRQRGAFFSRPVGASDPPWMRQQKHFYSWVGGLVMLHIAMGAFSEECFPCLSPTRVLVVVPGPRLHILFTVRKRSKNEEIEAHSLHISSLLDADLWPLAGSWISEQFRQAVFVTEPFKIEGAGKGCGVVSCSGCNNLRIWGVRSHHWSICSCHSDSVELWWWINQVEVTGYYLVTLRR